MKSIRIEELKRGYYVDQAGEGYACISPQDVMWTVGEMLGIEQGIVEEDTAEDMGADAAPEQPTHEDELKAAVQRLEDLLPHEKLRQLEDALAAAIKVATPELAEQVDAMIASERAKEQVAKDWTEVPAGERKFFRVGDTVQCPEYGEGKVVSEYNGKRYPLEVRFEEATESYTRDGFWMIEAEGKPDPEYVYSRKLRRCT